MNSWDEKSWKARAAAHFRALDCRALEPDMIEKVEPLYSHPLDGCKVTFSNGNVWHWDPMHGGGFWHSKVEMVSSLGTSFYLEDAIRWGRRCREVEAKAIERAQSAAALKLDIDVELLRYIDTHEAYETELALSLLTWLNAMLRPDESDFDWRGNRLVVKGDQPHR